MTSPDADPGTWKFGRKEFLVATGSSNALVGCDPVLARAIAFIEANIHRPLTLGDIAKYVGSSERHFSRRFREWTGSSPKRMLIILRMHRAAMLLEKTDLTSKEIAALGGNLGGFFWSYVSVDPRHPAREIPPDDKVSWEHDQPRIQMKDYTRGGC